MNEVLLDTHVWIWVSIEKRELLSNKARRFIDEATQKWISAISCWELAKLVQKKKISFSIPTTVWMRRALIECEINIAELSPEIAVESTQLKGLHQDPADQIIVATSRVLGMPLLTSDQKILEFLEAEAIW
ncbi:MAG: type II toxin-antitoxin system VapC family toxin [Pseudomonadota bacterium]